MLGNSCKLWTNNNKANFLLLSPISFPFIARILLNNPYHIRKPLLLPLRVVIELRKLLKLVVGYPFIIRKRILSKQEVHKSNDNK
jgi:hypothetical protein